MRWNLVLLFAVNTILNPNQFGQVTNSNTLFICKEWGIKLLAEGKYELAKEKLKYVLGNNKTNLESFIEYSQVLLA